MKLIFSITISFFFIFQVFVLKANNNTLNLTCNISSFSEKELRFEVYPNPAKDVLNIDVNSSTKKIEFYNVIGSLALEFYIKKSYLGNETIKIDVSMLNNGVYFLKLSSDTGSSMQKLVIKR